MRLLALAALFALDSGMPDGGARQDAGRNQVRAAAPKSAEDQEVIDNLELLQHLDESSDLDLMQELTLER